MVLVDEYDAAITKHIGTEQDPQSAVRELQDFIAFSRMIRAFCTAYF